MGASGAQLVGRWRWIASGRVVEAAAVQGWRWPGAGGEPGAGAAGAFAAGHGRARRGAEEVELPAHAEPAAQRVVLDLDGGPCIPTAIVTFA